MTPKLYTYEQGVENFFNELVAALDEGDLCANHLGLNGLPGCDSNPSTNIEAAFGAPVTEGDLEKLKEAAVPKKTRKQTSW